jgi:bilirubin oxidase
MLPTIKLVHLALALACLGTATAKDWLSPPYTWLYEFPLPIPPPKAPTKTYTNPVTGGQIQYFEVEIKELTQQVYPGKSPAKLVGYDGLSPGPTFQMTRGVESVVRFKNSAKMANSVHLHGSYSVCLTPCMALTSALPQPCHLAHGHVVLTKYCPTTANSLGWLG